MAARDRRAQRQDRLDLREELLDRRERRIAARESELTARRSIRRVGWAARLLPSAALQAVLALCVVVSVSLLPATDGRVAAALLGTVLLLIALHRLLDDEPPGS